MLSITNNRNDSGPSSGYECSILGESKSGVLDETINNNKIPQSMAKEWIIQFMNSVSSSLYICSLHRVYWVWKSIWFLFESVFLLRSTTLNAW